MKEMNKLRIFGVVSLLVVVCGVFVYATSDRLSKLHWHEGTAMYFPPTVDFAGEKAPLNIYDVRERFDRELLVNANLHSSTILIMKRANRAFPIIEPILAKYNVPDDFKYLAVIESALTNAVSPSGAKGFWQFLPDTAREKGLEVNDIVDERYHLEKSTEAACKYLLSAKEKFGSWTLAAASYNGGMNGVGKKIDEQMVGNYYDLLLTDETSRYVFRILALKEIMKNPNQYGFDISKQDLYENLPTKKVEIDSSITDLAQFAKTQGVNYKILKLHNPWLRDKKLENKNKKKYVLEIPTAGY
ncbi:lytic transglycosylase domain-containing protein [Flavobacterium sp. SUN046]|jgi:membrane-bound lytic murein transglycosylase D|uniref:lytic transglycosylase domain-containing protein n=1 Tax=Flavobacterium sp. SUN046 TaxID=3002440 RepID=UPI003FA3C45C